MEKIFLMFFPILGEKWVSKFFCQLLTFVLFFVLAIAKISNFWKMFVARSLSWAGEDQSKELKGKLREVSNEPAILE